MDSQRHYYGASWILRFGDHFVFGIKKVLNAEKQILLTGIGGKKNQNESFYECALRECEEEIGCRPILDQVEKTLLLADGITDIQDCKKKAKIYH